MAAVNKPSAKPGPATPVRSSPGDNVKPEGGVPLGHGTADEPANTMPAEPAQITRLPMHQSDDTTAKSAKSTKTGDKPQASGKALDEEPELKNEEDIPSDGRDVQGEAMIDKLGDSTSVKSAKAQADRAGKAS